MPSQVAARRGVYSVSDTIAVKHASASVKGVTGATFRMKDGTATIVGTKGDSIKAALVLGPHRDRHRGDCIREIVAAGEIEIRRVESTLVVRYEARGQSNCGEHWQIEVPRTLSFSATGEVAHITVSNAAADTYATTDIGNISIRSVSGNASARVRSVGNATVESSTSSYEEAVVESDVGRTELLIDGHRIDVRQAPGPGGRIALKGSGRDKLRAETGVGNARLNVGKTTAH